MENSAVFFRTIYNDSESDDPAVPYSFEMLYLFSDGNVKGSYEEELSPSQDREVSSRISPLKTANIASRVLNAIQLVDPGLISKLGNGFWNGTSEVPVTEYPDPDKHLIEIQAVNEGRVGRVVWTLGKQYQDEPISDIYVDLERIYSSLMSGRDLDAVIDGGGDIDWSEDEDF